MSLEQKVRLIKEAILAIVESESIECSGVIQHGSFEIHPKHLAFCVCVDTEPERARLESDWDLKNRLYGTLVEFAYPEEGRPEVRIGFESKEAVDRESGGNWQFHFK